MLTLGTASGTHIYRLPGEYTVTVTVPDDDAGTTSDTLVNTILGANDLKNRAILFLTPYADEKKVEKSKTVAGNQKDKLKKSGIVSSKKKKIAPPKQDSNQRDKIKVGSSVKLITTKQAGVVEEMKGDNIIVSFGFLRMKVKLDKLSFVK